MVPRSWNAEPPGGIPLVDGTAHRAFSRIGLRGYRLGERCDLWGRACRASSWVHGPEPRPGEQTPKKTKAFAGPLGYAERGSAREGSV
jgi:hypothetical protein